MVPPGFPPLPGTLPPLQPVKLTDFKLAGALGAGATAKVYEAIHIATGRGVAIKILEEIGEIDSGRQRRSGSQ